MQLTSTSQVVAQLDRLITRYNELDPERSGLPGQEWTARDLHGLMASAEEAIRRLSPPSSAYVERTNEIREYDANLPYRLECLMGIVDALRHDYNSGALGPIQELIRAEVFDDFLAMAQHLLEQGYKDPSAVLIGGVLEEELRKLAERSELPICGPDGRPLKAEALNASLAGKAVYNKLDQKSVTTWLDLRNKAAHAHFNEYTAEQVSMMLQGVRHLVVRLAPTV